MNSRLENEVGRESFDVSSHLLIEPLRGDAIERRKVHIEHYFLAADNEYAAYDGVDRD